jgi:hypothetical protein
MIAWSSDWTGELSSLERKQSADNRYSIVDLGASTSSAVQCLMRLRSAMQALDHTMPTKEQ